MKKTLMTLVLLGMGATSLATMASPADAGNKHGWHGHFKFHYAPHGYWYHHKPYHWKGGCRYYLKKARYTGKRYWWKKYKWCISSYHFAEDDD